MGIGSQSKRAARRHSVASHATLWEDKVLELQVLVEKRLSLTALTQDGGYVLQLLINNHNGVPLSIVGQFEEVVRLLGKPASSRLLRRALAFSYKVRVKYNPLCTEEVVMPESDVLHRARFFFLFEQRDTSTDGVLLRQCGMAGASLELPELKQFLENLMTTLPNQVQDRDLPKAMKECGGTLPRELVCKMAEVQSILGGRVACSVLILQLELRSSHLVRVVYSEDGEAILIPLSKNARNSMQQSSLLRNQAPQSPHSNNIDDTSVWDTSVLKAAKHNSIHCDATAIPQATPSKQQRQSEPARPRQTQLATVLANAPARYHSREQPSLQHADLQQRGEFLQRIGNRPQPVPMQNHFQMAATGSSPPPSTSHRWWQAARCCPAQRQNGPAGAPSSNKSTLSPAAKEFHPAALAMPPKEEFAPPSTPPPRARPEWRHVTPPQERKEPRPCPGAPRRKKRHHNNHEQHPHHPTNLDNRFSADPRAARRQQVHQPASRFRHARTHLHFSS